MTDQHQPDPVTADLHCYVINLEHAIERRAAISRSLDELNIRYRIIKGVDGRKLDVHRHPNYAPLLHLLFYGKDLSQGELGCCLAHRAVYRQMLDDGARFALVLEDDTIFTDDILPTLNALLHESRSWDLLRLLGRKKNYRSARHIARLPGSQSVLSRPLSIPGGANAYLINRKAAERLYSLTGRNWLAIDTLHGMVHHTGLRTLSVIPSPALPDEELVSCIDEQDSSFRWQKRRPESLPLAIIFPLTRGAWKLYLAINQLILRLRTWLPDRRLARSIHDNTDQPGTSP